MPTPIRMPDLGTNVEVVTLLSWLKDEGDSVKRGEALCEVETDKATSELESVAEGVLLRQVAPAGAEVEAGDIIAYVGAEGESVPEGDSDAPAKAGEAHAGRQVRRAAQKSEVPPLIRNLAERLGVDLNTVTGTGPGGRITREDVLRVANEQ